MTWRIVWQPPTRPRRSERPSSAAQRPSAKARSPPRLEHRPRLTPSLRANTYNVSPLACNLMSGSENVAEAQPVRMVPSASAAMAVRTEVSLAEDPLPFLRQPGRQASLPDPWLCVPTSRWVCPFGKGPSASQRGCSEHATLRAAGPLGSVTGSSWLTKLVGGPDQAGCWPPKGVRPNDTSADVVGARGVRLVDRRVR